MHTISSVSTPLRPRLPGPTSARSATTTCPARKRRIMEDEEREKNLERRRLQNRMSQRRFRERYSKKKTANGSETELQLRDAPSQNRHASEATATTAQPSLREEHSSMTPFDHLPQSFALAFNNHMNGDLDYILDYGLFGDEDLLHEIDFSGFDLPAPIDTNQTSQLSTMAVNKHDSFSPSPSRFMENPLCSDPKPYISTQPHGSATNSIAGPWPYSPASSTSQSAHANTSIADSTTVSTTTHSKGCKSWHGPLHIAARNGNNRITQLLMQHVTDCNEKDSEGRTPLMLAVIGDHEDVVRTLLSHGARVADTDKDQRTALHHAVLNLRADMIHVLLAHMRTDLSTVNAYDAGGMAPLHLAIDMDFMPGVQALLMVGADAASMARKN